MHNLQMILCQIFFQNYLSADLNFNSELLYSYVTETMKGLKKDFPFNQNRPTEPDNSPDDLSEFLSGLLESEMGSFFTGLDRTSTFGPPQWAPPLREPECAFCHSKTSDLKRCLGCKKVFYCDKKCQKQHRWEHKPECQ